MSRIRPPTSLRRYASQDDITSENTKTRRGIIENPNNDVSSKKGNYTSRVDNILNSRSAVLSSDHKHNHQTYYSSQVTSIKSENGYLLKADVEPHHRPATRVVTPVRPSESSISKLDPSRRFKMAPRGSPSLRGKNRNPSQERMAGGRGQGGGRQGDTNKILGHKKEFLGHKKEIWGQKKDNLAGCDFKCLKESKLLLLRSESARLNTSLLEKSEEETNVENDIRILETHIEDCSNILEDMNSDVSAILLNEKDRERIYESYLDKVTENEKSVKNNIKMNQKNIKITTDDCIKVQTSLDSLKHNISSTRNAIAVANEKEEEAKMLRRHLSLTLMAVIDEVEKDEKKIKNDLTVVRRISSEVHEACVNKFLSNIHVMCYMCRKQPPKRCGMQICASEIDMVDTVADDIKVSVSDDHLTMVELINQNSEKTDKNQKCLETSKQHYLYFDDLFVTDRLEKPWQLLNNNWPPLCEFIDKDFDDTKVDGELHFETDWLVDAEEHDAIIDSVTASVKATLNKALPHFCILNIGGNHSAARRVFWNTNTCRKIESRRITSNDGSLFIESYNPNTVPGILSTGLNHIFELTKSFKDVRLHASCEIVIVDPDLPPPQSPPPNEPKSQNPSNPTSVAYLNLLSEMRLPGLAGGRGTDSTFDKIQKVLNATKYMNSNTTSMMSQMDLQTSTLSDVPNATRRSSLLGDLSTCSNCILSRVYICGDELYADVVREVKRNSEMYFNRIVGGEGSRVNKESCCLHTVVQLKVDWTSPTNSSECRKFLFCDLTTYTECGNDSGTINSLNFLKDPHTRTVFNILNRIRGGESVGTTVEGSELTSPIAQQVKDIFKKKKKSVSVLVHGSSPCLSAVDTQLMRLASRWRFEWSEKRREGRRMGKHNH